MLIKRQDVCDNAVPAMPVKAYEENNVNQKRTETDTFVTTQKLDIADAVEIDTKEIYKRTLGNQ